MENIAHGIPMLKPDRYCKDCHGIYQPGGDKGQPSCFSCHGQYWDIADPDQSYAQYMLIILVVIFIIVVMKIRFKLCFLSRG